MGSDSSKIDKTILDKYKYKQTLETTIGEVKLYANKDKNDESIFCKVIRPEESKLLHNLEDTRAFLDSAQNVIRILELNVEETIMPLCGSEVTQIFIDPFETDLDQIIQRKKKSGTSFIEVEIWNTLIDIMKALYSYCVTDKEHG